MKTDLNHLSTALLTAAMLALVGCSGSNETPPPSTPPPSTSIGPAGGTVTSGNAQVQIPAGALTQNTPITIEATNVGAPALPSGVSAAGSMFAFKPHGTTFSVPVTVTVPFDPALVATGSQPQLYKTNAAMTAFEPITGATVSGSSMLAQISSFSFVIVGGIPPLTKHTPERTAVFSKILVDDSEPTVSAFVDVSGTDVEWTAEFGPLLRAQPRQAIGVAKFSNFGSTYGAYAEAPSGTLRLTNEAIGSETVVGQFQSFIKNTADASLTFTLSAFNLSAYDENPASRLADSFINARGTMSVSAFVVGGGAPPTFFYDAHSIVQMFGESDQWGHFIEDERYATHTLLKPEHFNPRNEIRWQPTGRCERVEAMLNLHQPVTFRVDLTAVAVGQEFTVISALEAIPLNRKGSGFAGDCQGSGATVNILDPQGVGGTTMNFTGLTPTNRPLLPPPAHTLPTVPVCAGPDVPEAGSVQFESTSYTMYDHALNGTQSVRITRTGGKTGAATFRLFSQDVGGAKVGVDYGKVDRTVFFADGYDTPRTETINVTFQASTQGDRPFNLFLERTGGCAAVGPASAAVVLIKD